MSEKNENSLYKEQKATKPKIEDVIPDWLDGDMKKSALDFVAWLRANKMSPTWTSANSWKSSYKGKGVCYIKLLYVDRNINNKYSWTIETYYSDWSKYNELIENEGLLKHLSENVWYCHGCDHKPSHCGKRRDVTILGKEIKGVCGNGYLSWFCDSDEATVNGIKKLIDFRRQEIKAGTVPYSKYRG